VLRPFAQRALGVARQDDALVQAALTGFESFGLDFHAGRPG
jgi:hypothetical protein